jgi:hypothetical protein
MAGPNQIYPEMTTFLGSAMKLIGPGWRRDPTPLSTSDLKKVFAGHEGVVRMCKAAVSVQLATKSASAPVAGRKKKAGSDGAVPSPRLSPLSPRSVRQRRRIP